ncbi:MAG: MarR family transcriptional regulator [Firmicutes bacterium]|nr:MarR family transcriptional regulator [Bacillota bacterium]
MLTSNLEDYLECIYRLREESGLVSVTDIADRMGVRAPSVTRAVKKLAREGYLFYEKYRGIALTPEGERTGRFFSDRHETLRQLLLVIGVRDVADRVVEGIEHYIDGRNLGRIKSFLGRVKG